MALISCPDCTKQVSSAAPACPGCGAPIAAASDVQGAGVSLTTVQETSKQLKGHVAGSALLIVIGLLMGVIGAKPAIVPALLVVVGLIWFCVTRCRIWWHHS